MLTLSPSLSPFVGASVPPSAIASANPATPADTFPLTLPPSAVTQPVILQVTAGGTGLQTFDAPLGTQRVDLIVYGTDTYTPAVDPGNIQPGEFVFNSLTLQITLLPRTALTVGRSLLVQTVDPNAVLTQYLLTASDALPDFFYRYNLTGAVGWSCGWEESPSGQFELITDWATADALEAELIPLETELEIYGVGFQVASLTITKKSPLENPNLEARVSVSLRGKWEEALEEQVILDSPNGASGGARTIRGDTTVQEIARRVGAIANLPPNRIAAPKKAGEEEQVSLQDVFEGNLRHHGCFARYSDAAAIVAVPLGGVPTHQVAYTDLFNQALEIQVNANPRAFDYKNGRLEWGEANYISMDGETTQGSLVDDLKPTWKERPPKRETVVTGSPSGLVAEFQKIRLEDPPLGISAIDDPSMIFDNGGMTKEQTITTTENGAIVHQVYRKYGFQAVGCDHLYVRINENNKFVWKSAYASPGAYWQPIEEWTATYQYDGTTGYLLRIEKRGWRSVRLKSEGSAESCQAYDDWIKAPSGSFAQNSKKNKLQRKLDFYRFQRIPLEEVTVFETERFRSYYPDIPPAPTEEAEIIFREFNGDGSRSRVFVPNEVSRSTEERDGLTYIRVRYTIPVPGWVEPRFCSFERSKKLCFLSAPDPDSTPKVPLPDLTTGEDKESERRIVVQRNVDSDQYLESSRLQTQRDAGFSRSAREADDSQQKGRPGEHVRKETVWERIDPKEKEDDGTQDEWEYVISTTTADDPRLVGETASYPYALNLAQAIRGVQTDLEINNTRDTKTTAIDLKHSLSIREGDLVNLEGHGEWRVLSYSKSLAILAPGVVQPGVMSLELGKRISGVQVSVIRQLKPKPPEDDGGSGTITGVSSNGSGALTGTTRGNPQGA